MSASETLSQATGIQFPSEEGKPNNVLKLEVEETSVTLGSAGLDASLTDFIRSLRAIAPRDGTVLNLPALPKEVEAALGPDPDEYKSSTPRSISGSGAKYEDFVFIPKLDRYFCGKPTANKSRRLMIADDIPAELIQDHHKQRFLLHVQKDRGWAKPALTGALKSTQSEGCYLRALRRWTEGTLKARTLAEATKVVTDGLRATEQAAERQAKAKADRKKTYKEQLREKDKALAASKREEERLRLQLADSELKAANLFPARPTMSTLTTEEAPAIDPVVSEVPPAPVAEPQDVALVDDGEGAAEEVLEEADLLSAAERARVNFILERKGLDPHPGNDIKPLLAEMIKLRPVLPVCTMCGEEWPFHHDGSDHQCKDIQVPNPDIPPAPGSFLDRQIKAAKAERECSYALCRDPTGHCLKGCPYLHQRCSICRCRGHDDQEMVWEGERIIICPKAPAKADAMDTTTKRPTWQDLYHAFELSADQGFLTRHRSQGHMAAGFWPCWSMRDIHFVRALGHGHTRSVCAEDVVEIMTTLSLRLRTCPGFADIPSFQALEERELSEITKEEVRIASMKQPAQTPRSKKAKRARESSIPSTSGSDISRPRSNRAPQPKASRPTKPKPVQSGSDSGPSFAAMATPKFAAPQPPAGLSSLGYYSGMDWAEEVEASTSTASTANTGADTGTLPGPERPGVDYAQHQLSAKYDQAVYQAWSRPGGPAALHAAEALASGPRPSRPDRGRGGGKGGHSKSRSHSRGSGNQPSGTNRGGGNAPRGANRGSGNAPSGTNRGGGNPPSGTGRGGGNQPSGINRGSGRGRGGPRGNRGGRGRGGGGASAPSLQDMGDVLRVASTLVEAAKAEAAEAAKNL